MRRDNPEQRLQIACAGFLLVALRQPTYWTAFPAGGGGRLRGAFLKAMGLKPGVPDLLVLHPQVAIGATVVFIELKSATGAESAQQKLTRRLLGKAGCYTGLARSIEDVATILRASDVPLFARPWGVGYASERL